jgi:hypothetical protein
VITSIRKIDLGTENTKKKLSGKAVAIDEWSLRASAASSLCLQVPLEKKFVVSPKCHFVTTSRLFNHGLSLFLSHCIFLSYLGRIVLRKKIYIQYFQRAVTTSAKDATCTNPPEISKMNAYAHAVCDAYRAVRLNTFDQSYVSLIRIVIFTEMRMGLVTERRH